MPSYVNVLIRKTLEVSKASDLYVHGGSFSSERVRLSEGVISPVNLAIFEAQHQTNCNRIVFNVI